MNKCKRHRVWRCYKPAIDNGVRRLIVEDKTYDELTDEEKKEAFGKKPPKCECST